MKQVVFVFFLFLSSNSLFAQPASDLPLTFLKNVDTTKPLLFYLSGDGGMNNFSKTLIQNFYNKGYSVVALDSKDYFWKKKTPEKTAADISQSIYFYLKKWKLKNFILIGYSFGADVAPFIFSRLPVEVNNKANQLVLLSPSQTTSFEIKILTMFGLGESKGLSVIDEINKLNKPVLFAFGSDEKDFPMNKIKIKTKDVLTLTGGHHYDGKETVLSQQLLKFFR